MAKPKIKRLGDPSNPYTKKKVTPAQQAASYKSAGRGAVRPGYTPPAKKKKTVNQVDATDSPYMRARKAAIERGLRRAGA